MRRRGERGRRDRPDCRLLYLSDKPELSQILHTARGVVRGVAALVKGRGRPLFDFTHAGRRELEDRF
jgi:hypothetical protein